MIDFSPYPHTPPTGPSNNFSNVVVNTTPAAAEIELAKALAEMAKAAAVIGEALKAPRGATYGIYIEAHKETE